MCEKPLTLGKKRASLEIKEDTMNRVILSFVIAGMGCLGVGFGALAQGVAISVPAQDAFLLTFLDDLKERVFELRGEISLTLVDPNLTRLQRAQLRGASRKTSLILRNISRAEKLEAQGKSFETLLSLIQNQLDALQTLLQSILSQLESFLDLERANAWPISPSIVVYDLRGTKVKVVRNEIIPILSNADLFKDLPNGIYLYRYIGRDNLHKLVVNR
jgi:hypothetical protein